MRELRIAVAMTVLVVAAPAFAKSAFAGQYRLRDGPDVAAFLNLKEDGRFEYALEAGALDETASGRWVEADGKATLHTEPKPKPPAFSVGPQGRSESGAFTLKVTWPNGRGIAGVDFKLGFDSGEPLIDYTQEDGWTQPHDDRRIPRWVELTEPIHLVASSRLRFDITKGKAVTYILTPNDMGVVDFDGAVVERVANAAKDDPDILLHRREGVMKFVRAGRLR